MSTKNRSRNLFEAAILTLLMMFLSGCDPDQPAPDIDADPSHDTSMDAEPTPSPGGDGDSDVAEPKTPDCKPSETRTNCETHSYNALCTTADDEGESIVTGQVACEQVMCACESASESPARPVRGVALCGECPTGSKGNPLPPITVLGD